MIVRVVAMDIVQPAIVDVVDMGAMLDGHVLFAIMAMHMVFARYRPGKLFGFGIG